VLKKKNLYVHRPFLRGGGATVIPVARQQCVKNTYKILVSVAGRKIHVILVKLCIFGAIKDDNFLIT
jgi:hypothetical protein